MLNGAWKAPRAIARRAIPTHLMFTDQMYKTRDVQSARKKNDKKIVLRSLVTSETLQNSKIRSDGALSNHLSITFINVFYSKSGADKGTDVNICYPAVSG